MAMLVQFHKTREDETRVEYQFGFLTTVDRTLVIDKASKRGRPADGTEDQAYAAALWKILQYHRLEEKWPARGEYAA